MEKQNKVVKKITKKSTADSKHIHNMKNNPNDECYTSMYDILSELNYWGGMGKFKGKNIICPCDWDIVAERDVYSVTIDYTDEYSATLSNNRAKAVWYDKFDPQNDTYNRKYISQDDIDIFLKKKVTCNFVRTLTQNASRWGIKSVTASGYDPSTGRGIPFQNVDYSKYDICITNPPFSLYGEFLNKLVGNIDFVILAPFLNRCASLEAIPMMEHKLHLGHEIQRHMDFVNPTPENQYNTTDASKVVCCDWLTSWPEAQNERNAKDYQTGISYETYKDEYEFMENMTMKDGTHPMIVGAGTIPDDYNGWMFAPISILDRLNADKYEMYCTTCNSYFNKVKPSANPFNHPLSAAMLNHNGKRKFAGWVIKKKSQSDDGKETK